MSDGPTLTLAIPVHGASPPVPLRRTLDGIHNILGTLSIEVVVQISLPASAELRALADAHPVAARTETAEDGGIYSAMNRLTERATGQRILFLGAGDLPLTGLSRAMERWSDVDDALELGGVRIPNAEPRVPRHYPPRWDRGLRWRNVTHHQGIAYPLQLLRTFGGFPTEYPVLGDYALNIDMWQEGVQARWSEGEDWVSAASGGVSRRFDKALYQEEKALKQAGLKPGLAKLLLPLWIRAKASWKRA